MSAPDERSPGPGERSAPRTWAAYRDGEIILQVTGPDAEQMVRHTDHDRIAYRERVKPTAENGWTPHGPWVEAGE